VFAAFHLRPRGVDHFNILSAGIENVAMGISNASGCSRGYFQSENVVP